MVGKNNRTTAAHGGTVFGGRQLIQQAFWQYAAEEAGAAALISLTPGASWPEPCAWMPGFRAKLSPGSNPIRAASGEDWLTSRDKRELTGKKGGVGRYTKGQKAPFLRTARLARAASVRKTAGKRRRRV